MNFLSAGAISLGVTRSLVIDYVDGGDDIRILEVIIRLREWPKELIHTFKNHGKDIVELNSCGEIFELGKSEL
ncbi:hypothetical protein F5Y06DRAFT_271968 [Hypoxylon sp. FL0890]|nr:hypothetical protein F5Y06DRAFT_271968 [Hypoxylon sp. FL0890]